MKLSKAAMIWIDYHRVHSKKNTLRSYQSIIEPFCQEFGDRPIGKVTPDETLSFLNRLTMGNRPYTKRIRLRPHDLRRHAATDASRSGVPIEIVSKVILRHSNLATTQRYQGTINDVEAIRWIDNIYA